MVTQERSVLRLGGRPELGDARIFEFFRQIVKTNLRLDDELPRIDWCKNLLFACLSLALRDFVTEAHISWKRPC